MTSNSDTCYSEMYTDQSENDPPSQPTPPPSSSVSQLGSVLPPSPLLSETVPKKGMYRNKKNSKHGDMNIILHFILFLLYFFTDVKKKKNFRWQKFFFKKDRANPVTAEGKNRRGYIVPGARRPPNASESHLTPEERALQVITQTILDNMKNKKWFS